jgi:hypothetical protein
VVTDEDWGSTIATNNIMAMASANSDEDWESMIVAVPGHHGCSLKTHHQLQSRKIENESTHCGKLRLPWKEWPKLDPLHPEIALPVRTAVELVATLSALEDVVEQLVVSEVVGFDTEGTPAATLQLVGGNPGCEIACIVDLVALGGRQLTPLAKIFTHEFEGVLVGMAVAGDVTKIGDVCGFRVTKPMVDLNDMSWGRAEIAQRYYDRGLDIKGLSKICVAVLGQSIGLRYPWNHIFNVTSSNWRHRPLTPKQVKYAILDAYACLAIYRTTFR